MNGSFWTSGSCLFALRKEAVHGDLPPSLSGPPFGWVDSWMGVRGWGARNYFFFLAELASGSACC